MSKQQDGGVINTTNSPNRTIAAVARESVYTPMQWMQPIWEAWSYGYGHEEIMEICRVAGHPANVTGILNLAQAGHRQDDGRETT